MQPHRHEAWIPTTMFLHVTISEQVYRWTNISTVNGHTCPHAYDLRMFAFTRICS